jgi:lysozyme
MEQQERIGSSMINAEGLSLIKKFEGCSLKPYLCPAGVPTIGYGHTRGVTMQTPEITKEEATALLRDDLDVFERGVFDLVTFEKLNENQFAALVSFAFNLGLGNLKRSTLLRLLNEDKPIAASAEFAKWNKAGGKVLKGLTLRREAERQLFLKPALIINRKQVRKNGKN